MLYIAPASGGEPIINVSGSNMDFSVTFSGGIADILAIGYLVDVAMTGSTANIHWYPLEYPGTPGKYVQYYQYNQFGGFSPRGVTYGSLTEISETIIYSYPTGTAIGSNLPSCDTIISTWYPNYYVNQLSQNMFFMGYTFFCKQSGYYNLYTDKIYTYIINQTTWSYYISYRATIKISLAGRSKETSVVAAGTGPGIYTEHDGLNETNVPLISGTAYTFEIDYKFQPLEYGDVPFPSSTWFYTIAFRESPPTGGEITPTFGYIYRVTGTAG